MGYDAKWCVLGASDAMFLEGDPALYHDRYRIFILATHRQATNNPEIGCGERREGRLNPGNSRKSQQSLSQVSNPECAEWRSAGIRGCRNWEIGLNSLQGRQETTGGVGKLGAMDAKSADANGGDKHGWICPLQVGRQRCAKEVEERIYGQGNQWAAEPAVGRMAYGVADRVDRLGAIGDGQVPSVVALAWQILEPHRLNAR
jgi:DNA (cytosine-5)-methyltransferase 1